MKRTVLLLFAIILCLSCCSCAPRWPEKSLTLAHTVEIIQYNPEDHGVWTTYTITYPNSISEICGVFSDLELKTTHIKEGIDTAFYITFIGQNGEIDHITVIAGRNTLMDKYGDLYNILGETDINGYLNGFLKKAPAKVERDPDEDYGVSLTLPAANRTFGKDDEPPVFSWSVHKGLPSGYYLEIDYLNNGTYMTKYLKDSIALQLTAEEWETIKSEAPTVDGVQKIQWRIRVDRVYHTDMEPFYTDWGYFWIDQNN